LSAYKSDRLDNANFIAADNAVVGAPIELNSHDGMDPNCNEARYAVKIHEARITNEAFQPDPLLLPLLL
jgi:hypothetical protein